MANRFPLIIDSATQRIEELPATDNLDLAGSNISSVANITSTGNITASYYLGNGSQLTGITVTPGGSNTQLQYNNNGVFGGISTVTYNGSNISLGVVGTVKITGGSSGQYLQTDGAGNLSFASLSSSSISNGTSNVNIATTNGNVTVGVAGVANTVVFASDRLVVNTPIVTANNTYIGNGTGNYSVTQTGRVAIGYQSGSGSQSADPTTAVGYQAGNVSQTQGSVAVGFKSGRSQGDASIAIGYQAGETQSTYSTAIGLFAGQNGQGSSAIGIGNQAGKDGQGTNGIGIGTNAGQTNQGANAIAIGISAGSTTQSPTAIAIGRSAGLGAQGANAIALGFESGYTGQLARGIAIGVQAGYNTQGADAIAIGRVAGGDLQGANSVAIGFNAGRTSQAANTIILNATGIALDQTVTNTFTVKPVRSANTGNLMFYNTTTGEISYDLIANTPSVYGEFYSTVDQTNPNVSNVNTMTFNTTGINNNVSIVSSSRITIAVTGTYNIQFSAQASQTSGGNHDLYIWLRKNGVDVAWTAGDVKVAGNGDRIMAAWNYIVDCVAGDYYELAWNGTDTSMVLDAVPAAGVVPGIPSVIATVVAVGAG